MELSTIFRYLGKTAACLGFIQGLAWLSMSLICIILFAEGTHYFGPTNSYMTTWNRIVYLLFLDKSTKNFATTFEGHVLLPPVFTVFTILYLLHSAAWIVISCGQYVAIAKNNNVVFWFKAWAFVTFVVTVLDLILMFLLGIDFHNCKTSYKTLAEKITVEEICTNTVIPVLLIAAKGFVLWIVNLVLAVSLNIISKGLLKKTKREENNSRNENSLPRVMVQRSPILETTAPKNPIVSGMGLTGNVSQNPWQNNQSGPSSSYLHQQQQYQQHPQQQYQQQQRQPYRS